jgi:hypothetical protein
VPVRYVAPLEMNEGTHWGQGYNRLTNSCSASDRPNKRPLTFNIQKQENVYINSVVHRVYVYIFVILYNGLLMAHIQAETIRQVKYNFKVACCVRL